LILTGTSLGSIDSLLRPKAPPGTAGQSMNELRSLDISSVPLLSISSRHAGVKQTEAYAATGRLTPLTVSLDGDALAMVMRIDL
jgi:hypothetical protein